MKTSQPTLFDIDACGYGRTIAAQAVVLLPPEPQVSVPNFVFNPLIIERDNARLCWRILIQVLASQVTEYQAEPNAETSIWYEKIKNTLERINELGKVFQPQSIPSDIIPPTAEYLALNVEMGNWCEALMQRITCLFSSVQIAGTLKIDLYTPDSALPVSSNAESLYNLPVLLVTDNIIIQQSDYPLIGD